MYSSTIPSNVTTFEIYPTQSNAAINVSTVAHDITMGQTNRWATPTDSRSTVMMTQNLTAEATTRKNFSISAETTTMSTFITLISTTQQKESILTTVEVITGTNNKTASYSGETTGQSEANNIIPGLLLWQLALIISVPLILTVILAVSIASYRAVKKKEIMDFESARKKNNSLATTKRSKIKMSVLRHDDDSVDDRVYAVDEKRAGLRSAQSSEEKRDSSDACQKQNETKDEEDCRSYKSQLSATSKAVPANSVNSCLSTHWATTQNDKSKPTTLPSPGSKTTKAKSNRSVLGIDKTALPPPPPPPPPSE